MVICFIYLDPLKLPDIPTLNNIIPLLCFISLLPKSNLIAILPLSISVRVVSIEEPILKLFWNVLLANPPPPVTTPQPDPGFEALLVGLSLMGPGIFAKILKFPLLNVGF